MPEHREAREALGATPPFRFPIALPEVFLRPRPTEDDPLRRRVIRLAGRLACPDDRFAAWAAQVGVACGPLEDEEKQDLIHQLDAAVAHLCGLAEAQLIHLFETFHERVGGRRYRPRWRSTVQIRAAA